MKKILSSADWHINLHKQKIPYDWQMNRYKLMFDKLHELERECDVHVIAGDLFDVKPQTDDTALLLSYLNTVTIPTLVIPGNHEATRKGRTFWEHFLLDNAIKNELVTVCVDNARVCLGGIWFCTFPYGSVQTDNLPDYVEGDVLVTHIRGEVPPHISAEYDFDKIKPWKLTLLGDLHFNHQYRNSNAYYPGSPVNTTYDRDDRRAYGVDIFEFESVDSYTKRFVDLKLPKLLRRTISVGEEMTPHDYHHVIYEVTGSLDEIAKIQKSNLLDKKLVQTSSAESKLDLRGKKTIEELDLYLQYSGISNVSSVINTYKSLGIST